MTGGCKDVACKEPDTAVLSPATEPATEAAVFATNGDASANNLACLYTLAVTASCL